MSTLADLFAKHGTDKNSTHSYATTYERLLAPYRDRPHAQALLEVGVLGGASIRAWREYFPTNWRIVGVDLDLRTSDISGAELFQADSMKADSVQAVLGDATFDVIIDDGGHGLWEQQPTWDNLLSRLRPGGLYVIEDLQSGEAGAWFVERGCEFVCLNHERPGSWDNMLAIYHKPITEET